MLQNLVIQNYSLIEDLELAPSANFNIITGETGAGKSIMLGAVGLLLGNRADTKVLLHTDRKCIIEGTFQIGSYKLETLFEEYDLDYTNQCIIRREISSNGKSRAFINDTPVTLDALKKLGDYLMDVHSQHDTLLLGSVAYQLSLLDGFASNQSALKDYQQAFKKYKDLQHRFQLKKNELQELQQQADYNQFIYTELAEAALIEGEMEAKEAELKKIEHAEDIKQKLEATLDALSNSEQSILSTLQNYNKQLQSIKQWSIAYETLANRLQSVFVELKDIEAELEAESAQVEFNPKLIPPIEERLNSIYSLLKKHRVQTVSELLILEKTLEGKVVSLDQLNEEVLQLEKEVKHTYDVVLSKAKVVSENRIKAVPKFEQSVKALLKELSMPDAHIQLVLSADAPTMYGIDKINMLFSANKGVAPNELKQVASGGEFSRLMLAIKYVLADKVALPTIIFDEIDTGISGEVSIKMGKMIREMSARHQVVVITHLPQIASMGDKHYFVFKDASGERSVSKMKELLAKERVTEIAKMIGGEKPSETALKNAMEMLESK
ncbi:DNA repair protein RecN [Cytophaga hutchinsonii]|jgi:DNA repair protein RecN (Recombination protein N)|uniref:DNA repair protein RecN n=1 Tax=Cytophaga hutchinsonii (strain ATCC 33406 / DSM 1761 / CIP 103989 / NBRC 15051 / NCIMB 9469 / D465) TaxID=269798 RepID=A0A6N4SUQ6_CYTH3|nr:DNA repair protein RecN [Cytophaga hutchinsonii]ABG60253.1 DNA replication and repair protein RecN [Cytophaga hutchinsonii ATCC 33406]SFX20726.1 DNA replication and repair protein RecN [Cytophaga hutchinsonii ATCC 33406]